MTLPTIPRAFNAATFAVVALMALAATSGAQQSAPTVDFSGVMYPQFRMNTDDATRNANGGKATSKFDIERVYLTFRMPAGDDGSIRVTTDVFNNSGSCAGCYAGWNVRIKYAYFNYNFLHDISGKKGFNAAVRFGMLHTAVIDQVESFWPRWISQSPAERNGFFNSSDVGVAGILTLPAKWGELYTTVANGTGYSTVERDPYKDASARLTLTPWGGTDGILKTVAISPWVYLGKSASKYLTTSGSAGTDAADGLTRNRAGVFVAVKDRRLTAGIEVSQRTETVETGASLATRGTYDNTGKLTSLFALVRPAELFSSDAKRRSRWGVLGRVDTFKPFSEVASAGAQTTGASNQLVIAGLWWDLNQRSSFSLDLQNLTPKSGSTLTESKVLFLHGQIAF
ncbi:MAG: hypothetical protein O2973_07900 [Gemmatimonadetes bacterium]|nr:hypothetical protein [Gemmatimonadota bacterium]